MVIILIVGTATGIIANHFVALFATNFTKKNRKLLIRNLESLTVDQVNDFGVASLVTRMGNDNNNAQRLIVAFFQMILPSPNNGSNIYIYDNKVITYFSLDTFIHYLSFCSCNSFNSI